MIIIIITLFFSLYLFWYFDRKRKLRNAQHQREKREAFIELLGTLKQQYENQNPDKKENET